jgi:hypothetical protein
VNAGERVITTYENATDTDLLVTSVVLNTDGQLDLPLFHDWLPAGDRTEISGASDASPGESELMLLLTFSIVEGGRERRSPDSPEVLLQYLRRALEAGVLRQAPVLTAKVLARPEYDQRQGMKR